MAQANPMSFCLFEERREKNECRERRPRVHMDALDQQGRPANRRDGRKREKREEESSEDAE